MCPDGRVVKALRSGRSGIYSAWVRVPLLAFSIFLSLHMSYTTVLGSTSIWRRAALLKAGFSDVILTPTLSDEEERELSADTSEQEATLIADAKLDRLIQKITGGEVPVPPQPLVLITADQIITLRPESGPEIKFTKPYTVARAMHDFRTYRTLSNRPISVLGMGVALMLPSEGSHRLAWRTVELDVVHSTLDLFAIPQDLPAFFRDHPLALSCCGSVCREDMPFLTVHGELASYEGLSIRLLREQLAAVESMLVSE
eukprot:gnl/Dysnectes_brevis/3666_a4688_539.p1 GENE.gnl/Dysnectes_brevis/3666_a4688_539~~gnl/Dysnectes_brevis/3666_a4688_539.p1  ORF type:complete len:257 (+),score=56.21 gnl/Dysnectes_brevis/3666_a4688_539:81-851(+)